MIRRPGQKHVHVCCPPHVTLKASANQKPYQGGRQVWRSVMRLEVGKAPGDASVCGGISFYTL